jgi:ATP-dependent DNA helicase RecG
MYAGRLEILGIKTLEDFLFHIPFRYEDYSLISPIGLLQPGETVTVRGNVLKIENQYTKHFKKVQKAVIADDTGSIEIIWFNQPYIAKYIKPNDTLSISGKVEWFNRAKSLMPTQYEIVQGENGVTIHTGRLIPIYPETKGISSKWLRRQVYSLLKQYEHQISEYLPEEIRKKWGLINLPTAIKQIHFPDSLQDAETAKTRLAFDELLLLQLQGLKKRNEWQTKKDGNPFVLETYKEKLALFFG